MDQIKNKIINLQFKVNTNYDKRRIVADKSKLNKQ